jgi:hypothetical protein
VVADAAEPLIRAEERFTPAVAVRTAARDSTEEDEDDDGFRGECELLAPDAAIEVVIEVEVEVEGAKGRTVVARVNEVSIQLLEVCS